MIGGVMRRKRLVLIIGLLAAMVVALALLPPILRKMPTRYALRLPEPLQALALPADPTPILPTVAAPVAAAGLLARDLPPPAIVTSVPVAASTPLANAAESIQAATGQPAATPTAPPPPTATPWPVPTTARMTGFTHVYQEWNNCGPATMVMALTHFGRTRS